MATGGGVVLPQLRSENFNNWLFRVRCLLEERQLIDILDVEPQKVEENEKVAFKLRDSKAKSLIVQCLTDKHLNLVKDCENAKTMIDVLNNAFQRKSVVSKLNLRRKLLNVKCAEDEKLEDYFHRFDSLIRELESISTKEIEEEDKICYLLTGLPKNFETVITAIETINPENLKLDFVKTRLLDEEMKLSTKEKVDLPGTAFVIKCFKCQSIGHKSYECKMENRGRGRSMTRGNRRNYRSRPQSYGRGRGLMTEESNYDKYNFVALHASCDGLPLHKFILDSGATEHFVRKELEPHMKNIQNLENPMHIVAANNKIMTAYKKGKLECYTKEGKTLNFEAIIVDELRFNLLSLSKIANNGHVIIMNEHTLKIKKKNSKYAIYAEKIHNLFILNLEMNRNKVLSAGMLWHKRLGHLNRHSLKLMNLPSSKEICEPCMRAKATRLPFKNPIRKSNYIGEMIHSDISGPVNPPTKKGYRYFQTILDDYSRFLKVYILKNKNEAAQNLINYIKEINTQKGVKVKRIRCDNGGEFSSSYFKSFCIKKGIKIEYTVAYSPQQNGSAERLNRTLYNKARTMMTETCLPKYLWAEAILCAAYQINRSISSVTGCIPAVLFREKNNLNIMKIFGSKAWATKLPRDAKFDDRAIETRMVGYGENGYRLWVPETDQVIISRDVRFDETQIKLSLENEMENNEIEEQRYKNNIQEIKKEEDKESEEEKNEDLENKIQNEEKIFTRSGRQVKTPEYLKNYETEANVTYCMLADVGYAMLNDIPTSFEEAIKDEEWKKAIDKELQALKNLETWEETKLPQGKKLIETRWIFKQKDDGVKKARLVVRGYQQKKDDFEIMYSPVARLTTVRMMISKAVQSNMIIHQLDIPTAFLNGTVKSEIYIKTPEGLKTNKDTVLKLKRSLYGLTESPKCWNERIDNFLKEKGFNRSGYDSCLYFTNKTWILIYVDDILIIGEEKEIIEEFKREFKAKYLGKMVKFLGMEILYNIDKITIKQTQMIEKILTTFNMTECKTMSSPMETRFDPKLEENEIINVPYRQLIGSLLYLTMTSRPDISYAVSLLSRYLDKPNENLWKAGKRIIRYLKGTKEKGLLFRRSDEEEVLWGYSDADWAGDKEERKSVSGAFIFQGHNPIAWLSKKQNCVALSSAESEYIAAATTAQEILNLKGVSANLGHDMKAILLVDNIGAISLSKSCENSKRAKHIDVKFNFIKDLIDKKIIEIQYVNTKDNFADIMTKSVTKEVFYKFINCFMIE